MGGNQALIFWLSCFHKALTLTKIDELPLRHVAEFHRVLLMTILLSLDVLKQKGIEAAKLEFDT